MKNFIITIRCPAGALRVLAGIITASVLLVGAAIGPAGAQLSNLKGNAATAPTPSTSGTPSSNNYAAGGQVRTPHAVEGDFFAAGGRVLVDQPVKGDATLAGGSVDVSAPVGDDVRAAGGDVNINSTVGGELIASAGNITLTRDSRIANAVSLFAGSVAINGKAAGPLNVRAQTIVLNGEVSGDARLVAEHIKLGPTAKIGGALSYASSTDLEKTDGAVIAGVITREDRTGAQQGGKGNRGGPGDKQGYGPCGQAWIVIFLALLACSAAFLAVFPTFATNAADSIKQKPWISLGLGFGTLVAVPLLAAVLIMTVLGIPLAFAAMALYPALMLLGFVVGVLFIARLVVTRTLKNAPESIGKTIGYFALALALTLLVAQIPFVGFWVVIILALIGIGACVRTVYRRRQVTPAPLRS